MYSQCGDNTSTIDSIINIYYSHDYSHSYSTVVHRIQLIRIWIQLNRECTIVKILYYKALL